MATTTFLATAQRVAISHASVTAIANALPARMGVQGINTFDHKQTTESLAYKIDRRAAMRIVAANISLAGPH